MRIMVTSQISLLVFVGIGIVLPFLVDLVTKRFASGALKSTLLLLLSLISGVLGEFLASLSADNPFDWATAGYASATAFVTGVATFYGFTSPVGISGSSGVIQKSLPAGLGTTTATTAPVEPAAEEPND